MKYLSSILFILAALLFAFHESISIRASNIGGGIQEQLAWHLSQIAAIVMFIAAGVAFGKWVGSVSSFVFKNPANPYGGTKFNWHDFGRIISVSLIGIGLYLIISYGGVWDIIGVAMFAPACYVFTLHLLIRR